MNDDQHIDDLAALYVVGAIESPERQTVEAHLRHCQRCRLIVADLGEVTDLLGLVAPLQTPPLHLRQTLLDRVRREPAGQWLAGQAMSEHQSPPPSLMLLSVGTLVLLAGLALAFSQYLRLEPHAPGTPPPAPVTVATIVATVTTRSSAALPLQPTGDFRAANGQIVVDHQHHRGKLVIEQLPAAPQGMAYQVWLSHAADRCPVGTFQVSDDGLTLIDLLLPGDVAAYRWLWVTLEPAEGSLEPTGPMILAASL